MEFQIGKRVRWLRLYRINRRQPYIWGLNQFIKDLDIQSGIKNPKGETDFERKYVYK